MQSRFCLFALLLLTGCKPQPDLLQKDVQSYIPVQEGSAVEFEVVRTIYNLSSAPETKTFRTRQVTGSPYHDQSGQVIYPISHYVLSQSSWLLDSVNLVSYNNEKVIANEHGQVIVKLSEPLVERNFWDGNAYNQSGRQLFTLVNVGKEMRMDDNVVANTITVVRQDDSTLLSRKRFGETFAEGIGLVKREIQMISYCYSTDCKGKGMIQSGITEISTIKRYVK